MVSVAKTILIGMQKYKKTRICPSCQNILEYKTYINWWVANKHNAKCRSCCQIGHQSSQKIDTGDCSRTCSKCNEKIYYKNRKSFLRAERTGGPCKSCVTRNFNSNREWSEYSISKIRDTKARNRVNDETYVSYGNINPIACEFIEQLNQTNGWKLQHARNGGEQMVCGYWLDGYDKEKNIVFEYDESFHYPYGKLRHKDIVRQNRIIAFLNCAFWRYNEKTKELYKVEASIPLDASTV